MTTRYLHGYYPSGYNLNPRFTGLDLESSCTVAGRGVTTTSATSIQNDGVVRATDGAGIINWVGDVTNGSAVDTKASIQGFVGVQITRGDSTLANFGTISGISAQGAYLQGGGRVINGTPDDKTATIQSSQGDALRTGISGVPAVVQNFGTIQSFGSSYSYDTGFLGDTSHVSLTNGSASDTGALIAGYNGVILITPGTVTNFGTIEADVAGAGGGRGIIFAPFQGADDLLVSEAGSRVVGQADVNGGGIEVVSGVASFAGGILTSGSVGGAGTLQLEGGTTRLEAGAQLSVADIEEVAGSVEVTGAVKDTGAWTMSGGSLLVEAHGALNLTQGLFNGGAATGAGVVRLAGGDLESFTIGGGGTLSLTGAVRQSGVTTVNAASTLRVGGDGAVIAGAVVGAGALRFSGGAATIEGADLGAGTVTVTGAAVTLLGTITAAGAVTVAGSKIGTSLIVGSGGATLQTGSWALSPRLGHNAVVEGATAGDTLTVAGATITGAGKLGDGQMTLVVGAQGAITGGGQTALIIDTGANRIVSSGLIEAVGAGGVDIKSAVVNEGAGGRLEANGGTMTIEGVVTGSGTAVIIQGALVFDAAFIQNVAFTGPTGRLVLAHAQNYRGSISGLSTQGGTALDLEDIGFVGAGEASFSGTSSSGVLTVSDGTRTARINLVGDYLGATFSAAADGHGGTSVTATTSGGAAPPHGFASAMAAHGAASTGQAIHTAEAWSARAPALSSPRTMTV